MNVRGVGVRAGFVVMAAVLALGGDAAGARASTAISPGLFETAAARGSVRVVVQLKVTEGADAVAIEAAKQALWRDLAGTTYRVIRDLRGLAVVVLDASSAALGALAASGAVAHVSPDEVRRPQR
jgi:hypothetical protein